MNVTLGKHEYTVVPQRHAYLRHTLGDKLTSLAESFGQGEGTEGLLDTVVDKSYDFLKVFIPDLMPQFEYEGYGTQAAFEAREYHPDADESPSPDQIITAFEAALKVNRLDILKHLGKALPEGLLQELVQASMGDLAATALEASSTSQSPNGASTSMTSGASSPTPEPLVSADSPSPGSTT